MSIFGFSDKDLKKAGNTKGSGHQYDIDGKRMNCPEIAKMLKLSQGYVHTQLQKEATAQNFVDRIRSKK